MQKQQKLLSINLALTKIFHNFRKTSIRLQNISVGFTVKRCYLFRFHPSPQGGLLSTRTQLPCHLLFLTSTDLPYRLWLSGTDMWFVLRQNSNDNVLFIWRTGLSSVPAVAHGSSVWWRCPIGVSGTISHRPDKPYLGSMKLSGGINFHRKWQMWKELNRKKSFLPVMIAQWRSYLLSVAIAESFSFEIFFVNSLSQGSILLGFCTKCYLKAAAEIINKYEYEWVRILKSITTEVDVAS